MLRLTVLLGLVITVVFGNYTIDRSCSFNTTNTVVQYGETVEMTITPSNPILCFLLARDPTTHSVVKFKYQIPDDDGDYSDPNENILMISYNYGCDANYCTTSAFYTADPDDVCFLASDFLNPDFPDSIPVTAALVDSSLDVIIPTHDVTFNIEFNWYDYCPGTYLWRDIFISAIVLVLVVICCVIPCVCVISLVLVKYYQRRKSLYSSVESYDETSSINPE